MNITWTIKHKDRSNFKINGQTYTNIITHIHWKCSASDDNIEETISGTVPFDIHEIRYTNSRGIEMVYPSVFDAQNYIPYEELTDDILIQWAKDFLGQNEIDRIESVVTQRYNGNYIPNQ